MGSRPASGTPVSSEGEADDLPATAAAAAAAAPAAAAIPTAPTAAAPAAARAGGVGDLDLQGPAVHFLAIELLDGLGRLFRRRHLDEAEAARVAGVTVGDDGRRLDHARLGEQFAQTVRGRGKSETSDEELVSHDLPPVDLPR